VTPQESREFWVRVYTAIFDVSQEVQRSAEKHGDQGHLRDGTGEAREFSADLRASRDFEELAHWAKKRCKAASSNEGGDGSITWEHILTEEWAEALSEKDTVALRSELVQVAAVAVKWIEAIDRRTT
jgi:hypothetical protein